MNVLSGLLEYGQLLERQEKVPAERTNVLELHSQILDDGE
jgi:hypothetical protein